MKAWFEPWSFCLRPEAASILLHWAGVLTLRPRRSFLPQVWPSWGTDPFGWKEGLGFRLMRSVLRLAEFAGNFHPAEMGGWVGWGGGEWAFFPLHETEPCIFFCKMPFYLSISVYTPVLKLCTPPLYGYSVYYLLFSYHWTFLLFPQFCNQSA